MIISIFASIGSENLGDELILKNEIKLLGEQYGEEIEFKVFTYDTDFVFFNKDNIEFIEYFPIGSKNPINIFKNIKNFFSLLSIVKESDLIVIGGGGLFYDNELEHVANPLNMWIFRTNIFRAFKKKILFYSIGLHIKKECNYKKIKKIFSGNIEVTVRDQYSKDLLEKLDIASELLLDPVFYDFGDAKKSLKKSYILKIIDAKNFNLLDISEINFLGKRIGISFRQGYLQKEEKNIEKIIQYILEKGGKIICIPHSFHKIDILSNDFIFLNSFAKKYKLEICKNMKESYKMYKKGEIDICFAMRLHSMILSQVYEIPFIAFNYGKKTKEILKVIEKKGNVL